jgi:hypothetical protein
MNVTQLGFIAEEVPDVVANHNRDAIYGAHIVATLTKVVKHLAAQVEQLKGRLRAL